MASYVACQICRARPAELTIIRKRGNDEIQNLVCRECGQVRARLYVRSELDLGSVLNLIGAKRAPEVEETCPLCGTTSIEIVSDGRPGCCFCYTRFESVISELIRNAQGHTRHVGKTLD